MKFVIPYGIRFGADGRVEVVPVAHVRVRKSRGSLEVPGIFVIDSGATISLLPSTDADALGLNLKSGEKIIVHGVTGDKLIGYRHRVIMIIEGNEIKSVPVIFSEREDIPRVLGREGVFSLFGIVFDEAKRRIAFLETSAERKIIDAAF